MDSIIAFRVLARNVSLMAHDYIKQDMELESQTGRISYQILGTLLGGVLLVCSFLAQIFFDGTVNAAGHTENFYASVLGFLAAILLGTPLVIVAVKDLARGHMHMNELVALAVLAAFAIGKYQE